jgi:hypothetical protein
MNEKDAERPEELTINLNLNKKKSKLTFENI